MIKWIAAKNVKMKRVVILRWNSWQSNVNIETRVRAWNVNSRKRRMTLISKYQFVSSNESFDLKLFWNFFIISLNCYLILFSNILVEKNRERERKEWEWKNLNLVLARSRQMDQISSITSWLKFSFFTQTIKKSREFNYHPLFSPLMIFIDNCIDSHTYFAYNWKSLIFGKWKIIREIQ